MKVILFVWILFIAAAFPAILAAPKPSTFSIYLLEEKVDPRTLRYNEGNWDELKLSREPLITEADIISYDFSKHAMKLKPEAIKRIPKPPVSGSPFVIVVNEERIYLGAFYTGLSSITCAVPVIVVDRSNQEADILLIERAYPPDKGKGSDRRSDERIRKAFSDLKKLQAL